MDKCAASPEAYGSFLTDAVLRSNACPPVRTQGNGLRNLALLDVRITSTAYARRRRRAYAVDGVRGRPRQ